MADCGTSVHTSIVRLWDTSSEVVICSADPVIKGAADEGSSWLSVEVVGYIIAFLR